MKEVRNGRQEEGKTEIKIRTRGRRKMRRENERKMRKVGEENEKD